MSVRRHACLQTSPASTRCEPLTSDSHTAQRRLSGSFSSALSVRSCLASSLLELIAACVAKPCRWSPAPALLPLPSHALPGLPARAACTSKTCARFSFSRTLRGLPCFRFRAWLLPRCTSAPRVAQSKHPAKPKPVSKLPALYSNLHRHNAVLRSHHAPHHQRVCSAPGGRTPPACSCPDGRARWRGEPSMLHVSDHRVQCQTLSVAV